MVAESVRDDGSGHVEELLADCGAEGCCYRDTDLLEECGQAVEAERLAGPAAGEQPGGRLVGGGVHVVAVGGVLPQQGGGGFGDG
ncbi:hypothetical protein ACFU3O_36945 [Streptomyces antibioticus]|uniref:hypothetical protein n=1 Tax=Streptomyces antibioticus TaxID=1890 RepID=UPI00368B5AFD